MTLVPTAVDDFCSRRRFFLPSGTSSFFSPKWLAIVSLYLLSAALMCCDPWYGGEMFSYAQGGYVILLSMILVFTLSFDWCYLGQSRGGNLFLQFLLLLPMTLLLGRLVGSPPETSVQNATLFSALKSTFKSAADLIGLLDLIPNAVKDLFASFKSASLFLMICFSLTVASSKALRVGMTVTIFAFLISFTMSDAKAPPSSPFVAGMVLMLLGLVMHFHDITPESIDRNILLHLRTVTDEAERRCSIRVLKKVCLDEHVAPRTVFEIIYRCYAEEFHVDPSVVRSHVAPLILNRLVSEHGLLEIAYARGVAEIRPSPALVHPHSPLLLVAMVPRCVVVGVIALFWWLTPVDLIPDSIPFVGSLDDFVIVTLGGGGVLQSVRALRDRHSRPLSS